MKIFLPVFLAILAAAAVIGGVVKYQNMQASAAHLREIRVEGIKGNLKVLSAAADQYFLEKRQWAITDHNSKMEVRASELIGPGKLLSDVVPYDGEDYSSMVIREGDTLKIKTASGLEVEVWQ